MSSKIESQFNDFNGAFGGTGERSQYLPIQALPSNKKTQKWKEHTMDALERIGISQLHKNIMFREYYKMKDGEFTYTATGFDNEFMSMPWFDKEVRTLRAGKGIPTYIKHFDFIGIIVNALASMYAEFDDVFRVDSKDEYSTNEFIRQKTEMMHRYAQQVFQDELNKMLAIRGFDVNKQDFQSEEEQQQYQQEYEQQVKALTPPEIEKFLSKNFKVLATEWAQNVLERDRDDFYLAALDVEEFIDYLLTGRNFRHFRVGFDSYTIERWRPEEVFFSQDVDAKFPQEGEYVGRITTMSTSDILNKFGHLMSYKQQEAIGNYWNQTEKYDTSNSLNGQSLMQKVFPRSETVPFHNYYDHEIMLQMEDALGTPLGVTTQKDADGNEFSFNSWIPRMENNTDFHSNLYSRYLRDDIEVRRDTVRVTEAYWRSYKRVGVLIYENVAGVPTLEIVSDDLLPDFLAENEIKKLKNISLQELQDALKKGDFTEYLNTITYTYHPEVWKGVKIQGNASTVKDDIYLDVKPLDYQIKGGMSNIYDVRLPVVGIIDVGITQKLIPYQQLHNIAMNQITELLEKELGVFFTFDITGLPSEYQDETTEESIYRVRDLIKDTGFFGLDLSRQNTQGNSPNIFQRQEITFATQVQYRWQLAQQYKQEALAQIGITPQVLGQPNTYTTAEGVKQGAQASYTLINPHFDKINVSKAKGMEVHLAIAQYCQVNGKDKTVIMRGSDGDHTLLDILAEDGELFPLRHLGVRPMTSSKDRKTIEQIKQFVINDNTISRSMEDVISVLTNPVLTEIKDTVQKMTIRSRQETQEQRDYELQLNQQNLDALAQEKQADREWNEASKERDRETSLERENISALGRASDKQSDLQGIEAINKASQDALNNNYREQELSIKEGDNQRKQIQDAEHNKRELQKIGLKAQEIQLKKQQIEASKFNSIINKN